MLGWCFEKISRTQKRSLALPRSCWKKACWWLCFRSLSLDCEVRSAFQGCYLWSSAVYRSFYWPTPQDFPAVSLNFPITFLSPFRFSLGSHLPCDCHAVANLNPILRWNLNWSLWPVIEVSEWFFWWMANQRVANLRSLYLLISPLWILPPWSIARNASPSSYRYLASTFGFLISWWDSFATSLNLPTRR